MCVNNLILLNLFFYFFFLKKKREKFVCVFDTYIIITIFDFFVSDLKKEEKKNYTQHTHTDKKWKLALEYYLACYSLRQHSTHHLPWKQ